MLSRQPSVPDCQAHETCTASRRKRVRSFTLATLVEGYCMASVALADSKAPEQAGGTSPLPRARITGFVYLLYFLTAVFAQFLVGRRLTEYGDVVNVIAIACYIAVTLLFYQMFKPVNSRLSLFAALFSLAGCAVMALRLFHLAPAHISPFLFFGPYNILIGYLILRSTFLPRFLGVLMALSGLGWLMFLTPLANGRSSYFEVLGILTEGSLMLWLLVIGVDLPKWKARTTRTNVA